MKTDENTLEIKAIEGGSIRCSLLNDFESRSAFGAIRAGTALAGMLSNLLFSSLCCLSCLHVGNHFLFTTDSFASTRYIIIINEQKK